MSNREKDVNEEGNNLHEEELLSGESTPDNENFDMPPSAEEKTENPAKAQLSGEEKLKAEINELNEKYLRLYSEFDNFRRRTAKERSDLLKTAGQDVLVAMLPVVDDFERAMKSMENATDVEPVKEGVKLIHGKLTSILSQKGLKPMDAVGKDFDVDFHEAITKIPAPTPDLKGKVVDEVEKGYTLHDKVVRFAKVVIGE